jgi:APA family basic amino acid/polyamine antiporter
MATALVIGNMIGSGVFLLPAVLGGYGTSSLVAFALTAAGALLLALVFGSLGRAFPATGGPYVYSRRAFGDFIGFQQAWGYWIAIWAGNAAIAIAFVSYLGEYWGGLRDNNLLAALVASALIWMLTAVNALGVRRGGAVQLATTVLKFVPLVAVAVIGVFFMKRGNFGAFNATGGDSNFQAITVAATLTLWSFIGLESATVPAEDVDRPERTIPFATIAGTAVTSVLYILATAVVFGVVGTAAAAGSGAPFADAAQEIFGGWGADLITLCALASTLGALNGWILLQAQVPFAAARDGLFPGAFARRNARDVPAIGLVVSSVLVTGLVFMNYTESLVDQFTFIILLATLTTLVPYAFSAMAQVSLLVTDRARFVGARFARDATIAVLAFAYSMWTIAGSGYEVVFKGFMLLLAGTPVYVWLQWQSHHGDADRATGTPGRGTDRSSRSSRPAATGRSGEVVQAPAPTAVPVGS